MRLTLQRFLLPELGGAGAADSQLRNWISSGRFTFLECKDEVWEYTAYSSGELYRSFSPDYQRFSFASIETFVLASLEHQRCYASSWSLLKLYYSAYFAAHAISRAVGSGHVNLDMAALRKSNEYLEIYGVEQSVSPGSYEVEVVESGDDLQLKLRRSVEGQGVHDGFWRYFCRLMNHLAIRAVDDALPSAGVFVREVDTLVKCISEGGPSSVWFSAIRNAINYRHEFNCWLPNDRRSPVHKLDLLNGFGNCDELENSLYERQNQLERLVNLSRFLASLNREISEIVSRSSGGNSPFSRSLRRVNMSLGV